MGRQNTTSESRNTVSKLQAGLFFVIAVVSIGLMWRLEDSEIEIKRLHIQLLNERIEHLRLKTAMAIIYMDDIVEKKDGSGVEIKWLPKP